MAYCEKFDSPLEIKKISTDFSVFSYAFRVGEKKLNKNKIFGITL